MKCACKDENCKAEIVFDNYGFLMRMNPCAGVRDKEEPEFHFDLDANAAVELIKELKNYLLQTAEGKWWNS